MNAIAAICTAETDADRGVIRPRWFRPSGFFRACRGVRPVGGIFLRRSRSIWRAAPTDMACGRRSRAGCHPAPASRSRTGPTIPRVFPDAFRELHVRHADAFLPDLILDALTAERTCQTPHHAARRHADARAVQRDGTSSTCISHGSSGLLRGQGADLTVRQDRVFPQNRGRPAARACDLAARGRRLLLIHSSSGRTRRSASPD